MLKTFLINFLLIFLKNLFLIIYNMEAISHESQETTRISL